MENTEEYLQKTVIIIGAGISGLASASQLRDYGFENVLVLEARDRIGGRTNTISYKTDEATEACDFIELGAQWIHGQDGNIIYELAHSKGLVNESLPHYSNSLMDFSLFYGEEKTEIINNLLNFIDEKIEEIPKDIKIDTSLSDYLDKAFVEYVMKYNDLKLVEFLKGVYDWYNKLSCELNGCKSVSSLSAGLLSEYKECEGSQTVELKFGFSSILNLLYEKIPDETILKNSVVSKIDWSDFKPEQNASDGRSPEHSQNCKTDVGMKIKVYCENGETFEADHVICTIPLGKLKKEAETLFVPSLSSNKLKAIHSLGFDAVNKIFLEFSDPFWDFGTIYNVIWTKSLEEVIEAPDKDSKTWLKYINRFAYTPGYRNMLCAWVVGEGAITMESLSEDEVSCHCMGLLEKMLDKQLPKPKSVVRSTWNSDPYTYGSYSYLSVDSDADTCSQIAEPEFSNIFCSQHPVLQFAGEATHSAHFSTVHGAYETGLREAQRLLNHYRNCVLGNPFSVESVPENVDVLCKKLFHENMKILVIGGGIAGLAAAASLHKKGFTDISVLEAQESIGGRISSLPFNGKFLELGAQWIHGNKNPLYDFSVANSLLCDQSDEPSCEGMGLFCTSSGEIIEESVLEEVKCVLEGLKNSLCDGEVNNASESVETFYFESFDAYLHSKGTDPLNSVRKGLFNWFLKFEKIDNACDYLDQVAVQCYSEWCDISEEMYHINFKNGFISVVNALSADLPTQSIQLKKAVKTINLQKHIILPQYTKICLKNRTLDNYPVFVECEDGDKIEADVVILTASVGYIQENLHSLFTPALPGDKAKAFKNIGFGTINKIYLIYEVPFWRLEDQGFQLVWTSDLDDEFSDLFKKHPWIDGITGFDVVRKHPNVLLGWVGGVESKMIENIDTEIISTVCTKLLRKFLKNADIPHPLKTIRTCWHSNKYVRGAYSYRSQDFYISNSKLEDLQSPLFSSFETERGKTVKWPVVLFAGEAMDENCFSSVHGAYQSGLKAADNIDELYFYLKDFTEECSEEEQNDF